jgi:hypothetical protein
LWAPLAVLVTYFALTVSLWWWLALCVPAMLIWQRAGFRRQANDALIIAVVATPELHAPLVTSIKKSMAVKQAVDEITRHPEFGNVEGHSLSLRSVEFVDGDNYRVLMRLPDGRDVVVSLDRDFNPSAGFESSHAEGSNAAAPGGSTAGHGTLAR